MKIGILTYHRAHNYGAILQAIATRVALQNMGHKVYYVDYWPEYHKDAYRFFSWKRFKKGKLSYLVNRLMLWREHHARIAHFEDAINQFIAPYCKDVSEQFDVIIYGSDQIWRKQKATETFNPVYFGANHFKAGKHITYAASMGDLQKSEEDQIFLKNILGNFNAISVRENELKDYLVQLGISSNLVIDPTLLLNSTQWDVLLNPKTIITSGYVLYYSLQSNVFERTTLQEFAQSKSLRLVEIKGVAGKDTDTEKSQCGPFEFVSLVKHADYVFTTSYHGLAFSIIYGKQFFTSFKTNSGRAETLLGLLGLSDRLITPKAASVPDLPHIDYDLVKSKIDKLKFQSTSFISRVLTPQN